MFENFLFYIKKLNFADDIKQHFCYYVNKYD